MAFIPKLKLGLFEAGLIAGIITVLLLIVAGYLIPVSDPQAPAQTQDVVYPG